MKLATAIGSFQESSLEVVQSVVRRALCIKSRDVINAWWWPLLDGNSLFKENNCQVPINALSIRGYSGSFRVIVNLHIRYFRVLLSLQIWLLALLFLFGITCSRDLVFMARQFCLLKAGLVINYIRKIFVCAWGSDQAQNVILLYSCASDPDGITVEMRLRISFWRPPIWLQDLWWSCAWQSCWMKFTMPPHPFFVHWTWLFSI